MNLNTPKHYNKIFKNRNFKIDYRDGVREDALLWKFAGGRFLDLGCGVSTICKRAKLKILDSEVIGLDFSDKLIDVLRERFPRITYIVGDVRDLKFPDEYFDYIVLGEVLEHMEEPEKVLEGIVRILAPEGILAISVPTNEEDLPKEHLQLFTEDKLKEFLNKYGDTETSILKDNRKQFIIGYLTKKHGR